MAQARFILAWPSQEPGSNLLSYKRITEATASELKGSFVQIVEVKNV